MLSRAGRTLRELRHSGVREIAKLRLPQFSGLSFVSKVRTFLDPINHVVLDIQLLKLRNQERPNVLHEVAYKEDTSIQMTKRIKPSANNDAAFADALQRTNSATSAFVRLMSNAGFFTLSRLIICNWRRR